MGLGYVGLPTAAVLASAGYEVRGVETRREVREVIATGRAHIVEPDLDMLVNAGVKTGRLVASEEVGEAEVFIICVPTPLAGDRSPDLSFVISAAEQIAPFLKAGDLVIVESTVAPGTSEMVWALLSERSGLKGEEILVAHAPERVLPGRVLHEVVSNPRIIGGVNAESTKACVDFYRSFVRGEVFETGARCAEMVKLAENSFRDVNIAFANEMSLVADHLDLDVDEVIRLANAHPRVSILKPGPGVGGHCIAVDPYFLIHAAPDCSSLMREAREVNRTKTRWVIGKVLETARQITGVKVAVLGLAYKADSDDLRESPAVEIARALREEGLELLVVEPHLREYSEFELVDLPVAVAAADLVLTLVAHSQFRELEDSAVKGKVLLDIAGVFTQMV